MFDFFIKYLQDKITLSDEEVEMIRVVAIEKRLRKRQYLLQGGDVWRFNAFVCSGLLKTYSIDNNGREHIIYFAIENYWTGDRESLATEQPSKYNIEAIEDSELILIKKADFEMLCKSISVFNDLINAIIQKSFLVSQNRIHSIISLSAEEKYRNFISQYPNILNRVPLHMIASYLGITRETLSRIRSQYVGK